MRRARLVDATCVRFEIFEVDVIERDGELLLFHADFFWSESVGCSCAWNLRVMRPFVRSKTESSTRTRSPTDVIVAELPCELADREVRLVTERAAHGEDIARRVDDGAKHFEMRVGRHSAASFTASA